MPWLQVFGLIHTLNPEFLCRHFPALISGALFFSTLTYGLLRLVSLHKCIKTAAVCKQSSV